MAIDSEAKRASALYFVSHRKGRLIPDGTIASPDFQDIVGFYVGIAASAPVGVENAPIGFLHKGSKHLFVGKGPKHGFKNKGSKHRFTHILR